MFARLSFVASLCLLSLGNGFLPIIKTNTKPNLIVMNMDYAAVQEIEAARTSFVLCFAAALGSAAVGREGECLDSIVLANSDVNLRMSHHFFVAIVDLLYTATIQKLFP